MVSIFLAPAAVVGGRQEVGVFPDPLEGFQDDFLASDVIGAKPFCVSLGPKINTLEVSVSIGDGLLGEFTGGNNLGLLVGRAVGVFVAPLVMDMPGSGEIAGALDLRNTLKCGVQVLVDAVSVDIDGVASGAGPSEAVCRRGLGSFHQMMPDESKMI